MKLKRLLIWSLIGTGISSVTTQLLVVREFLSQFHGNEITIALCLFCWLLLTGLGSFLAKGIRRSSLKTYALLTLTAALFPLMMIVLIRGLRDMVFVHGASAGFYPVLFYISAAVMPYCLLLGFLLPYAQKLCNDQGYGLVSGDIYLIDSIGDILGGALFAFVLVYWVKPLPTMALTSMLLIVVSLMLLHISGKFVLLLAGIFLAFVYLYYATHSAFERRTLSGQYGEIVHYVESPYGRIILSKEGTQHTFWESGLPLYSDTDVVRSEEKVHYPLCQLDNVEDVLLISGGLGQTLSEVKKYGPKHVDYVEIDPYLTKMALATGTIKSEPFLEIINMDGRRFISETKKKYDAVIIDLPDPDTFQINRFYTSEFLSLAKGALTQGGLLSIGMEYSPNYISDIRRSKLSTLYATTRNHFSNVTILPGGEAYFLCRDGDIRTDIPVRLREKGIQTDYIQGSYGGDVTEERIREINESVKKNERANFDFKPRLVQLVFQEWFVIHGTSPIYFIIVLSGLTVIYLAFIRREEYILFCTGLATMGVEMLVVLSFQVVFGYVYLQIGAIVTAFLLGLLPGVTIGKISEKRPFFKIVVSEISLLVLLIVFLAWTLFLRKEVHPLYFLGYGLVFSFICGFQFPVVTGMIGEQKSPLAGCLAADLSGAAIGTFATGVILIPLLGIRSAVVFLILVKISSSMIVWLTNRTGNAP
ncbi:MAG: fused MFS/spermidine synthase [Desulfatiglans sp.]|jgi:spermidine synthase|nr:fused MFS/spermidine synthase [Desulfatiglans sp.]